MDKKELMPFKKYAETQGKLYHINTIKINGTFKDMVTGEIVEGDIFEAHKIGKGTLEETYKLYIDWFNHVRELFENRREFVSVKLAEDKQEAEG